MTRASREHLPGSGQREGTHSVLLSEDEASLINAVSAYIGAGLSAGEACILITTPSHRQRLEQRLLTDGFDLTEARASGLLVLKDAATTLSRFLLEEEPDAIRFAEVVGPLLEARAQGNKSVRIFG